MSGSAHAVTAIVCVDATSEGEASLILERDYAGKVRR
jgi:hypothetical protein